MIIGQIRFSITLRHLTTPKSRPIEIHQDSQKEISIQSKKVLFLSMKDAFRTNFRLPVSIVCQS